MVHPVDPYASKVLKPDIHARLVEGIKTYAAQANIAPNRIWTSLYDTDALNRTGFLGGRSVWVRRPRL